MTVSETALISFFADIPPENQDVTNVAVKICSALNLSVAPDAEEPISSEAVNEIDTPRVRLFHDDVEITFDFNTSIIDGKIPDPFLDISVDADCLNDALIAEDSDSYTGFAGTLISLLTEFATELDPRYVSVINTGFSDSAHPPKEVTPKTTPIKLDRIPWIGVYSEPLIEKFGGRDRVLMTPAWQVTELDNGSIMIIKSQQPWEDLSRDQPVDNYLLDNCDL